MAPVVEYLPASDCHAQHCRYVMYLEKLRGWKRNPALPVEGCRSEDSSLRWRREGKRLTLGTDRTLTRAPLLVNLTLNPLDAGFGR